MKKFIVLLALCILLTGCGKSSNDIELDLIKQYGAENVLRVEHGKFIVVSGELVEVHTGSFCLTETTVYVDDISDFIQKRYMKFSEPLGE